VKDYSTENVNQ